MLTNYGQELLTLMSILNRECIDLRQQGWSMPKIARHYGVSTVAVYKFIKARLPHLAKRRKLQGPCVICGRDTTNLHADHDHQTGQERGLLCSSCNRGLGLFQDQPELLRKAAVYLESYA
jgi:hypothetical protein